MNVLFISSLSGNLFAGPNYSVPAQIRAQSKIDNVFWYNLNEVKFEEWCELNCKNLKDFPAGQLKYLPPPFSNPDLVVVEEFYCYPFSIIIEDIIRNSIPYIIIPRSELTRQGQHKKRIKKYIGNILYFNRMARKAAAIQYLSEQERHDSGTRWNKRSLVIPNGMDIPNITKDSFSDNEIHAVYIGRYEKYQKGLDILIQAIYSVRHNLRKARFRLHMFGVDQGGTVNALKKEIERLNIEDLFEFNDAVFGTEKQKQLIESDLFIMTSRFEGMPMGLLEALSYGIPCLITKGTNMTLEVEKYDAGWTAETDKNSISNALTAMANNTSSFMEKGKNARKLAEYYSWDEIAKMSSIQYKSILGK